MKKARVILYFIIVYFLIYFLQTNFFSWFTIRGVQPNLFVVWILIIGLNTNSKVGQIVGFIIGLYTDFLYSNAIGISAILFMLIGYSGEFLQKRFPKNSKITLIIMSSITTGGYELLRVCYRYMFYSSHIAFIQFVTTLSIELLFNAILIIILYPIINKIGIIADDTFNGNDAITKYF